MPQKSPSTWPAEFELDGQPEQHSPDFELEIVDPSRDLDAVQGELYLPDGNPEQPADSPQLPLSEDMQPPRYDIQLSDGRTASFQHAQSLLESLEAQNIDVHFQCRDGYCGSCRVQLLEGHVHYAKEPLAFLDDNEILPCCCIPTSALKIKL